MCFQCFWGVQGLARQLLKTQEGSQEAISGFSGPCRAILEPHNSGRLSLCFLFAKMAHVGSIRSHLGSHFWSNFGTKSAWAQEDHQEFQITENLHLQKTLKNKLFFRFFEGPRPSRQHLNTQKGSQEAILGYLKPHKSPQAGLARRPFQGPYGLIRLHRALFKVDCFCLK
jgi:hypothetical protein